MPSLCNNPECHAKGFPRSISGWGCTFCDGSEGGNYPSERILAENVPCDGGTITLPLYAQILSVKNNQSKGIDVFYRAWDNVPLATNKIQIHVVCPGSKVPVGPLRLLGMVMRDALHCHVFMQNCN